MSGYLLPISAPGPWLTSNASTNRHWRHRQRLASTWREAAAWRARQARIPSFAEPVAIVGTIHKADRRIYDVDGATATIKACVDGLRDAGVLTGDDYRYVRSVTSEWGEPDKVNPRLMLRIEVAAHV